MCKSPLHPFHHHLNLETPDSKRESDVCDEILGHEAEMCFKVDSSGRNLCSILTSEAIRALFC